MHLLAGSGQRHGCPCGADGGKMFRTMRTWTWTLLLLSSVEPFWRPGNRLFLHIPGLLRERDGLSNPTEPLKFCPNSTICSRRIGMFPDPRVADRAVLGGDADIASTSTLFYGSVFFHKPSNTALTDPFRTWTDIRGTMKTTVVSLNQPDSCNVGYTNMRTGKSLAYSSRMKPGATCNYTISSPTIVGARASTYSNEGYGYLRIELST